jgi:hypothetical protein
MALVPPPATAIMLGRNIAGPGNRKIRPQRPKMDIPPVRKCKSHDKAKKKNSMPTNKEEVCERAVAEREHLFFTFLSGFW